MRDAGPEGDLADLSVADLGHGYRSGAFTPVDALDAAFARIDRHEAAVNAFVHLDRATSRAMAEASAARHACGAPLGPLDGITVSVKDLTPVAGWPNRRGSAALPDTPAPEDAPCVARLREAGAVFLGKTATPESGSRIVTRSAVHGVTRNPWDLTRSPGGSSGGAAAALALGMGTLATGTDGAGSIRIPAAFCNLVGLKPGFGRVPSFPPSHFAPHSVIGPMGRRAADVAAMAAVMARPDPRDPFAWPVAFDRGAAAAAPLDGLRIAVTHDLGTGTRPDASVRAALGRVADALAQAGAAVEACDPEWPVPPARPFEVFWETSYAGLLDLYPDETAARMDPLIHAIAARGRQIGTGRYHRALNDRLALTAAAHAFLTRFDAVLCPSVIGAAFDLKAEAPAGCAPDDWAWCPYAYLFNMTAQPAIAVPAGFDAAGLPLGVQLAARQGRDEILLAIAAAVEPRVGCAAAVPPARAAG